MKNCDVSRKEIGESKKHLLKWHKKLFQSCELVLLHRGALQGYNTNRNYRNVQECSCENAEIRIEGEHYYENDFAS